MFSFIVLSLLFNCKTEKSEIETIENSVEEGIDSVTNEADQTLVKAIDFNLPSIDGQHKSLADYKGKLIYMDIWATWCGPCRMQFPVMKELHEKYAGENIVILSVSIDPDEHRSKWETMVKEQGLKGEQLFAGQASGFPENYKVDFIPRFVLISPQGDLLMENAPMPLDFNTGGINPELTKIFDLYLQANKS